VLDNSRGDQFSAEEMAYLEQDLKAHSTQPVKFIVSHRPSWIFNVLLRNPGFELHQLAKKYGVHSVIAGHVHEMLHFNLDDIDYVSMVSSGGHLRASGKYEDGWFFGYASVEVRKNEAIFEIHDLAGHVTGLKDWGAAGLKR
jgi:3',5'-cyclic-AMP phosphodiesterase